MLKQFDMYLSQVVLYKVIKNDQFNIIFLSSQDRLSTELTLALLPSEFRGTLILWKLLFIRE